MTLRDDNETPEPHDDPYASGIFPVVKEEEDSDWPFVRIVLYVALAVILLALITSCGETREEQKQEKKAEVQVEQVVTKTSPLVADTPVGQITIQPAQVTVERKQTTETTTDAKAHAETHIDPTPPPAVTALGSSLLGLIPGVGGIGAAALAFLSRQKAVGALKATVTAIDEFKDDAADGHTVEKLHSCLSKHMDRKHKALVRGLRK